MKPKITDWELSGNIVTFYGRNRKIIGSEEVKTLIEDYIKAMNNGGY